MVKIRNPLISRLPKTYGGKKVVGGMSTAGGIDVLQLEGGETVKRISPYIREKYGRGSGAVLKTFNQKELKQFEQGIQQFSVAESQLMDYERRALGLPIRVTLSQRILRPGQRGFIPREQRIKLIPRVERTLQEQRQRALNDIAKQKEELAQQKVKYLSSRPK